ncbi:hypothetical protein ACFL04_00665 [Patescibacteria group bacterium]
MIDLIILLAAITSVPFLMKKALKPKPVEDEETTVEPEFKLPLWVKLTTAGMYVIALMQQYKIIKKHGVSWFSADHVVTGLLVLGIILTVLTVVLHQVKLQAQRSGKIEVKRGLATGRPGMLRVGVYAAFIWAPLALYVLLPTVALNQFLHWLSDIGWAGQGMLFMVLTFIYSLVYRKATGESTGPLVGAMTFLYFFLLIIGFNPTELMAATTEFTPEHVTWMTHHGWGWWFLITLSISAIFFLWYGKRKKWHWGYTFLGALPICLVLLGGTYALKIFPPGHLPNHYTKGQTVLDSLPPELPDGEDRLLRVTTYNDQNYGLAKAGDVLKFGDRFEGFARVFTHESKGLRPDDWEVVSLASPTPLPKDLGFEAYRWPCPNDPVCWPVLMVKRLSKGMSRNDQTQYEAVWPGKVVRIEYDGELILSTNKPEPFTWIWKVRSCWIFDMKHYRVTA